MPFNIVTNLMRKYRKQGILQPEFLYITKGDYERLNDRSHGWKDNEKGAGYPIQWFRTAEIIIKDDIKSSFFV